MLDNGTWFLPQSRNMSSPSVPCSFSFCYAAPSGGWYRGNFRAWLKTLKDTIQESVSFERVHTVLEMLEFNFVILRLVI